MDFPTHLNVDAVILLELLHDYIRPVLQNELDTVLLEVGRGTLPTHFFYQVVSWHEDSGAAEAEPDYESFCHYLFSADIQEQVDKALHNELL